MKYIKTISILSVLFFLFTSNVFSSPSEFPDETPQQIKQRPGFLDLPVDNLCDILKKFSKHDNIPSLYASYWTCKTIKNIIDEYIIVDISEYIRDFPEGSIPFKQIYLKGFFNGLPISLRPDQIMYGQIVSYYEPQEDFYEGQEKIYEVFPQRLSSFSNGHLNGELKIVIAEGKYGQMDDGTPVEIELSTFFPNNINLFYIEKSMENYKFIFEEKLNLSNKINHKRMFNYFCASIVTEESARALLLILEKCTTQENINRLDEELVLWGVFEFVNFLMNVSIERLEICEDSNQIVGLLWSLGESYPAHRRSRALNAIPKHIFDKCQNGLQLENLLEQTRHFLDYNTSNVFSLIPSPILAKCTNAKQISLIFEEIRKELWKRSIEYISLDLIESSKNGKTIVQYLRIINLIPNRVLKDYTPDELSPFLVKITEWPKNKRVSIFEQIPSHIWNNAGDELIKYLNQIQLEEEQRKFTSASTFSKLPNNANA